MINYICDHYMISRTQRNKEMNLGLGEEGTMSYEQTGCYKCQGDNLVCEKYQTELRLIKSEVNNKLIMALGKL